MGLLAYHVLSSRLDYVGDEEYADAGPVELMVEPYRRVFVLHVTVVVGAFAIGAVGAPVGLLVVMVAMKTPLMDLRGHWREHDRSDRTPPGPGPTDDHRP